MNVNIELKDHQLIPINYMKNHRAIILYHSTGSGKTLTALYSLYEQSNNRIEIIIIGPKSSKKAFMDDIEKTHMKKELFQFYTFTKIKIILKDNLNFFKDKNIIIDEAHNLRNETIDNLYIISALGLSNKIVLLTATPVINYMNDLSVLINIVKNREILPTERNMFDNMYYDDDRMELMNIDLLKNKISCAISYYKTSDKINYPSEIEHYMEVEMDHDQLDEYIYYVKKYIYESDQVYNENILDFDYAVLNKKKKNMFLMATRQLSNIADKSRTSPKIQNIITMIKKGPYPIVLYSNFLKNGVYHIATELEKLNISYKAITGSTSIDKINLIVNAYNQNKYKVLLLSSTGSESLDLKGTRQIHIMEPHWNEPRITQVKGRVIRYHSHQHLPLSDRKVDVYYWISKFPKKIKNISADQYLISMSKKKKEIFDRYINVIIEMSIENHQSECIEETNNNQSRISNFTADDEYYIKKYIHNNR